MDASLKKFLVMEPGQLEALELLCKDINDQWNKSGVKQATEFDTIWELARREGAKALASELKRRLYDIRTKGFPTGGQEQEE